jgi:plasmid stabilization system protein ParE
MAAFRLTPSAEEHIGEIVEFIAADNEDAAVRVRNALYSAFDLHGARDVAQILNDVG